MATVLRAVSAKSWLLRDAAAVLMRLAMQAQSAMRVKSAIAKRAQFDFSCNSQKKTM